MYCGVGSLLFQAYIAQSVAIITAPLGFKQVVGVAKRAETGSLPKNYYPKRTAEDGDKVQSLNLVMTHDAGAYPMTNHQGTVYKENSNTVCQGHSIVDQFKAGVTIFDFRVNENGYLVHDYALQDFEFGNAIKEAEDLSDAVVESESGRFAILLVKGKGWIDTISAKMDASKIFKGTYDRNTTVGDVKNKLVLVHAHTTAGAFKLQVSQFNKMSPFADPTDEQMVHKFEAVCPHRLEKQIHGQIKASFSNTGILVSPFCQTMNKLDTIREEMKHLFNFHSGDCPVIISVDAGAELLDDKYALKVEEKCR